MAEEAEVTRLLSQCEVEEVMFHGGIKRAENMMARAEDKGRAVTNPYAKAILDEYVLPLSNAIRSELSTRRVGVRQAHAALLDALDPDAVASLAIRTCLNVVFQIGSRADLRAVARAIGTTVHNELVLEQIADAAPELYYTLSRDFNRRLSKDERHRMTVFKMQAKDAGIVVIEWPLGARDQVGIYLLGLIEAMGMVNIEDPILQHNKVKPRLVTISPDLMERIEQVKGFVAITMPVFGPCVEPPLDWTTNADGGFHTKDMRRAHGTLVRHRLARTPYYMDADMPVVRAAVNQLQRTKWAVNQKVLDLVLEIGKHFSVGEVMSMKSDPRPEPLEWIKDGLPREQWGVEREAALTAWKRTMTEWYTRKKLQAVSFGRFYSATRAADMFKAYPAIHFVYFADSRGRLYPMTYGMNPQGSDLQKGLLRFAEGLPLTDADAVMWFCVQGANKFGFDKASLEDRQAWVMAREAEIIACAEEPLDCKWWTEAADPIQFIAWCMEFRRWRLWPSAFVSHLPISMDGSCNGLQNLSALLRDEVGGEATNLTDSPTMQDIYRRVAEASLARLTAMSCADPDLESLRVRWVQHGVSRSVVKRSVMTTPYGVTKRAAQEYIISDYLRGLENNPFEKKEWQKAAGLLMEAVWPAIGDVVVKGRQAMDWLKACAKAILKAVPEGDEPVITWTSPSGFPAAQAYYVAEIHRINTKLHGPMKIRVLTETDEADLSKHSNGLAPNFVHSMDAAHLHLATAACANARIDAVAMIHDDYGTHAAKAQALYQIIREQFVLMYETHDPILEFKAKYQECPEPPSRGTLDIREVLRSRYFFS
jgi:DNA-directed RNA polymerase